MKKRFVQICFAAALTGLYFSSPASAAKYSGGSEAKVNSTLPAANEKKQPPENATAMPDADIRAAAPMTMNELRLFLQDWRKYARWLKTDGNEYKAVAYLGVSRSADYPVEVVRWMDEHGWAVDRFFLLERKLRITLSVQEQEKKQTMLRTHLEKQMKAVDENNTLSPEQKKSMKDRYFGTIKTLREVMSAKAPVSPEEYELIKFNHDAIAKVMAE